MLKRGDLLFKICPQCGKEFSYIKSRERKFCSKECYIKSKQTGEDIQCDNCGKLFHRRQYHIDRQKNRGQNSFCSLKCQKEYLHKQTYEMRQCEICGEKFEVSKLSTQRFCSDECQIRWQATQVGSLNPRFASILTSCTYCGKEHYVKPYKFEQQENFFCSLQCRQAWYAEVFSQSDDFKEFSRQKILKQFQSQEIITETLPQRIVDNILDEMNIEYKREEPFEFFTVDNYLLLHNLIIEVNGDYWHTNPTRYTSKITKVQYDRIGRDKAKHTYFTNRYNTEILYLWEYDLIHNKDLCKKLIERYINNKGILPNYHSFNYIIDNNEIVLNQKIILAYQEMPVEQYKQLLQITS